MKKHLLTWGILGLTWPAFAQVPTVGPWTEVNLVAPGTAASTVVDKTVTLSPTFCWALTRNGRVLVPGNVAGTTFLTRVPTGSTGFSAIDISAVSNTTAFCGLIGNGGGEVLRTTDGGATWTKVTTSAQFGNNGFLDVVQFFDANTGIAFGDPIAPTSGTGLSVFEIHRTTNASAAAPTWTRIIAPVLTQVDDGEYGVSRTATSLGNTIWIATDASGAQTTTVNNRILRSTDQGLTWTSYAIPLRGATNLAFKDQNNGIACVSGGNSAASNRPTLARTTDGGVTWTTVPLPAGRDTLRGKFYNYNIDAIPGRGFVSVGQAIRNDTHRTNFGASFSTDGISWYDLEKGGNIYSSADFITCSNSTDPRAYQGYLGGITKSASSTTPGAGGLFQVSASTCALVPLATTLPRTATLRGLSVAPNPSTTGLFEVSLATGFSAAAQVTVFDALGRVVATRPLQTVGAGNATSFTLDLSHAHTGLYILHLVSNDETITSRLSIE